MNSNRKVIASLVALMIHLAATSYGIDYYVAPNGSDNAPGAKDSPFRTIQKAAEVLRAADTCHIAPGIYRETVIPKYSGSEGQPIVFRAAGNGEVAIVGSEPIQNWTKHTGHIYKATMPWSLGKNNQIFVDGKSLQEARWPNDLDGDPMTPDGMEIGGGSVDHIQCPQFSDDWTAEDLIGSVVWALPESQWSSWTATTSDYVPETKSVMFESFEGDWWVEARHNPKSKKGIFYLVGAFSLLDAPGEWYYCEEEKQCYLLAHENADPNNHQVEAKARKLGFDLSGRSWITVDGIQLHSCSIDLDNAHNCLVQNVRARYISHTRGGRTSSKINEKSGIYIGGSHNRLESCEIGYSAGSGVTLRGMDNAVVNCWIHDINYIGSYCSPINIEGMRHLISHNTIERAGRDCIKLGGAEHLIQFNDIGFPGRICHDLGAIYSGGQDGGNTRISHNFVHNNPGLGSNVGIYLDNYMKNYMIDHNIVWNVGNAIRLNRPTGFCMVINNTVFGNIHNNWGLWDGQKVQWGCHVMNNLSSGPIKMNPEVVMRANIQQENLSDVFNVKTRTHGTGNLGKGKGVSVADIATGEGVDVGARRHNMPAWTAGHDFKTPPKVLYSPERSPLRNYIRNAAFEYSRYSEKALAEVDPLIHWTPIGAGSALVEYHRGFNSPPANERNSVHGNSVVLGGEEDNGIKQVITDLTPNTTYYFSGYVKHAQGVNVEFIVRPAGEEPVRASSTDVLLEEGQTWRFVSVSFKTDHGESSATVEIVKRGPGQTYVDNTGIVPNISGPPKH